MSDQPDSETPQQERPTSGPSEETKRRIEARKRKQAELAAAKAAKEQEQAGDNGGSDAVPDTSTGGTDAAVKDESSSPGAGDSAAKAATPEPVQGQTDTDAPTPEPKQSDDATAPAPVTDDKDAASKANEEKMRANLERLQKEEAQNQASKANEEKMRANLERLKKEEEEAQKAKAAEDEKATDTPPSTSVDAPAKTPTPEPKDDTTSPAPAKTPTPEPKDGDAAAKAATPEPAEGQSEGPTSATAPAPVTDDKDAASKANEEKMRANLERLQKEEAQNQASKANEEKMRANLERLRKEEEEAQKAKQGEEENQAAVKTASPEPSIDKNDAAAKTDDLESEGKKQVSGDAKGDEKEDGVQGQTDTNAPTPEPKQSDDATAPAPVTDDKDAVSKANEEKMRANLERLKKEEAQNQASKANEEKMRANLERLKKEEEEAQKAKAAEDKKATAPAKSPTPEPAPTPSTMSGLSSSTSSPTPDDDDDNTNNKQAGKQQQQQQQGSEARPASGVSARMEEFERRAPKTSELGLIVSEAHEPMDGSDLVLLDKMTAQLQDEGKYLESLRYMECSLVVRKEVHGLDSEVLWKACEVFVISANALAVEYLNVDDYETAYTLLKKCVTLTEKHGYIHHDLLRLKLAAVTFNNLASYYHRRGKHHAALQYLTHALKIEVTIPDADNPACTHLNLCSVLSKLGRHERALEHAQCALELLTSEVKKPTRGHLTSAKANSRNLLCVAYHNMAVQQEQLFQTETALKSFHKAVDVARDELGDEHPMTAEIKLAYAECEEHHRKMQGSGTGVR